MQKTDAILIQICTSYIHIDVRSDEPQLGQYYIAEYASRNGLIVKVKKYSSQEPIINSILELSEKYHCTTFGFYIDSENIWTVRRVALGIKQIRQELKLIIGGPQVTGDPKLALSRIPYADFAIVGEGERPITQLLLMKLDNKEDLNKIKGIAYINRQGEYIYTGKQTTCIDLDEYPFPRRHLYSLDPFISFNQISTGRGCVGRCAFCFEGSKTENLLRMRSVESVIQEIDYIVAQLKRPFISFLDDTFIIDRKRTARICNHMIEQYGGKIAWFCEARVDILIKNIELIPLMKRAGLKRVQLGGESGVQQILDAYKKGMQVQDLLLVVQKLYEGGIDNVYVNFIVGGAHETLETFNSTLELALKILETAPGCAEVGCSLLTPYVGTPIRNNPNYYGVEIIDPNVITGLDGAIPCVRTKELSEYKIQQLRDIFEDEVNKKYMELIKGMPKDRIMLHYKNNQEFGLFSLWYKNLKTIETVNNYFEAITNYHFKSLHNIETENELMASVPFRTCQPISDGEKYFAFDFRNQYQTLQSVEKDIFLLSTGKLCFCEILHLIEAKYSDCLAKEELKLKVMEVFEKFDDNCLIVWKTEF